VLTHMLLLKNLCLWAARKPRLSFAESRTYRRPESQVFGQTTKNIGIGEGRCAGWLSPQRRKPKDGHGCCGKKDECLTSNSCFSQECFDFRVEVPGNRESSGISIRS
jgi:hypothetical protein